MAFPPVFQSVEEMRKERDKALRKVEELRRKNDRLKRKIRKLKSQIATGEITAVGSRIEEEEDYE